jgi:hypothetical protein
VTCAKVPVGCSFGAKATKKAKQKLAFAVPSAAFFGRSSNMSDEAWIKELEDGRKVKFVYQELPEDGAFLTAQLEGNEVVYSVVLAKARNPLSREDVENRFRNELSKK